MSLKSIPVHNWHFVSTVPACCPVSLQMAVSLNNLVPIVKLTCPGAPLQQTISLDRPTTPALSASKKLPDLYPIHLANITKSQETELRNTIFTSPVHIHTPTAHLALIQQRINGQFISARDVVFDIQVFARLSVDYVVYSQLCGEMKEKVKAAFMQRKGHSHAATASWDMFSSGEHTTAGPIGADLLLGCTSIWGLERVSLGGYSIIHLA